MPRLSICCVAVVVALMAGRSPAQATGDLTRQEPVELRVALGNAAGAHVFEPNELTLETGKLYKLVLTNPSKTKHYFTSPGLARSVFTRKVQVVDARGTLAEIKGTISEIEVYPGGVTEWWFVPVAAGSFSDLHCHIKAGDGRTHAEHGMTGTITIK